jgi:LPS sulfotransferase NodH
MASARSLISAIKVQATARPKKPVVNLEQVLHIVKSLRASPVRHDYNGYFLRTGISYSLYQRLSKDTDTYSTLTRMGVVVKSQENWGETGDEYIAWVKCDVDGVPELDTSVLDTLAEE